MPSLYMASLQGRWNRPYPHVAPCVDGLSSSTWIHWFSVVGICETDHIVFFLFFP